MNIGFVACIILAVLFLIIGIVFALLKEKGAKYVSGFRTLNHPEKYDKAYISLDMRNQCFTYALILFLGCIDSIPRSYSFLFHICHYRYTNLCSMGYSFL